MNLKKPISSIFIIVDGKAHQGLNKESVNNLGVEGAKPYSLYHGQDKRPLDLIIGFCKVNLDEKSIKDLGINPFHALANNNNIIQKEVPLNEACFLMPHNFG